ncbi:MAG: NAD(P)-dependent oxidoreductase [Candidatus Tectomicrobia bacterium]|uniref:NAD(P)-dependent oxidoreductase n=1 Tax=Tectimicrobiota bacterium TaxID=2528274 RepID=A0A932I220_UNCTE|nr:NAD(P)-dependent oxidoreductase [Candidatus Tectomicrobia bacterium]
MSIKVGVVGLGVMGGAFAGHLLDAGYEVAGYDPAEAMYGKFQGKKLRRAASPADAARGADLVMTSLPNYTYVEKAVEGPGGVLEGIGREAVIADMSTVPPKFARAMAEKAQGKGVAWLDCPVSGVGKQAAVKDLVVMSSGPKAAFEKVKPAFDAIGKKTVYVGERNGMAAQLKLVVNLVLFINMAGAAEGLTLGLKAGLPADVMLDTLCSGAAASNVLQVRGKDMLAGNFPPSGPITIVMKDIDCIIGSAKDANSPTPLIGLLEHLYMSQRSKGREMEDGSSIFRIYKELANLS